MESIKQQFHKSLGNAFRNVAGDPKNPKDSFGSIMSALNTATKEVKEEEFDESFEETSKVESKESTGSSSSGSFSQPMFTKPVKNKLFQPGTKSKLTKSVNEDEIPGGLAKGMSIKDIAKKHDISLKKLKSQLNKGVGVEMEHTTSKKVAKEIAMDHIFEDPNYYDKLEKIEGKKEESKEATTSSSAGAYDVPFGAPKKDPLALDTSKNVYSKLRSVRDPNFPRFGGKKGSTYVKIKDKCKKFPYCNQGDIKALEFFENDLVKEAIKNITKRYRINENYIKGVILENTNIYYKNTDMNKELENMIDGIVDKVLSEEINNKTKQITESVSSEIDEMEEYYEVAKNRKLERKVNKEEPKEDMGKAPEIGQEYNREIGVYSNIKKQREMKEDEKPDFLDLDGDGNKKESMKKAAKDKNKKKKETKEATGASSSGSFNAPLDWQESTDEKPTLQLSEDEMINLIEKIIEEQRIEGTTSQTKSLKQSEKDTETYMKDLTKKLKNFLKGSEGKYDANPKTFPKGNGDLKDDKMMYTASDGVEEYIKQIARSGGQENLEYDQIKPDEEWLDKNIMGSSDTGNNPEWANAVATDVGAEVKERMEKNVLAQLKNMSYNKAPQPVTDYAGKKTHKSKMAGITLPESKKEDKKSQKINEDVDRIKSMFTHNYKTQ